MADHDPAGMLGSFFGGGAIAAVIAAGLNAFRKPSAPAEMIQAAANVAKEMMGELRTEVERQGEKLDNQDAKLVAMAAQHAECERRLSESERDRRELGLKIDDLLSGRIAQPGEPDLFR